MPNEDLKALENVLLGDTTAKVVEKINTAISHIEQNALDIETNAENIGEAVHTITIGDNPISYEVKNNNVKLPVYSITEVNNKVAEAGKVDKIILEGILTPYEPDSNKIVTLPVYDIDAIDLKFSEVQLSIGNLAGGMRYKGTIGTGGTVTALPTGAAVANGDTYKVKTAGTYANQSADVGDLFIASKSGDTVTWTLVPSGDDGDVYSDNNFTANQIIIADGGSSKKVKSSGKTIATSVTESDATVPTSKAVVTHVASAIENAMSITVLINANTFAVDATLASTSGTVYKSKQAYANYIPVAIYNSNGKKCFLDIGKDSNGYVIFEVDDNYMSATAGSISNGGYVLLIYVGD